ncbi:exoskeleton protein RP43-like [Dreissena polymorpha]|uniref:exoskeleton protein RP43-like n=1 Tax=Dreissena polymorpha TaxID=45954 RepID=UPI0022654110|nr:exoskeleton protein RP43-like [Dreissena polymorpha]
MSQGNSTSSPGLDAGLCGSPKTGEFVTRGRHALITFGTDASLTKRGFEFTYLSAADTSGTGCSSEYTLTASEQAQFLTSQNFPAFYSRNSFCRWEIVPSSAQSAVSVKVTFADIEADDNCRYDKMEIYDDSA